MELIEYLQSLATNGLTMVATIFEFLGQLPFFIIIFALFYLVFDKKFAFKYWLTYFLGFAIGSLALKNIIANPRPYQKNASLRAIQNAYSGSLPSATAILAGQNSIYFYASVRKNTGTVTYTATEKQDTIIRITIFAVPALIILIGINGIFLGTIISTLVAPLWVEPKILYKHYFKKSVWNYFKRYLFDAVIMVVSAGICFFVSMDDFNNSIIFSFIPFAHKNSSKSNGYISTTVSYPTGTESCPSSAFFPYPFTPKREPVAMTSKRPSI